MGLGFAPDPSRGRKSCSCPAPTPPSIASPAPFGIDVFKFSRSKSQIFFTSRKEAWCHRTGWTPPVKFPNEIVQNSHLSDRSRIRVLLPRAGSTQAPFPCVPNVTFWDYFSFPSCQSPGRYKPINFNNQNFEKAAFPHGAESELRQLPQSKRQKNRLPASGRIRVGSPRAGY